MMWSLMSTKGVTIFVRRIVGPDGKPCLGAKDLKDLEDRLKAELVEATKD